MSLIIEPSPITTAVFAARPEPVMALTFRSRIFRLLLLFAAVPSIVLTVVGYYLASDPLPLTSPETVSGTNELREYFYNILYEDISLSLDSQLTQGNNSTNNLDFIVRIDTIGTFNPDNLLPVKVQERLLLEILNSKEGLFEVDKQFYQYAVKDVSDPTGGHIVGGIIHDSSLALMLGTAYQRPSPTDSQNELRATYVLFLGILFLVVILIMIVAAYIFSSRVSQNLAEPVAALSQAANLIAAGDFKQNIKLAASGEIGTLILNFNRMAAQLDQVSMRLLQTERVAAWRQVARRFAHELKNPLQPILVSLYRLEQQLSTTEVWSQVEEPLRAAREEVQHLTELAERFSTLAKLPPPSIQRVDLTKLTESTAILYREKLTPYEFVLNLPPDSIHVQTDAGFVREALHNLLQNAIDACQPGEKIELKLAQLSETIELSLCDSGSGMDRATLDSARLPYFTTKSKGNGLGSAIVERSMAELGGQLRVQSTKGTGTEVTLIFRLGDK